MRATRSAQLVLPGSKDRPGAGHEGAVGQFDPWLDQSRDFDAALHIRACRLRTVQKRRIEDEPRE